MNTKNTLIIGALLAGVGVALGAFGAHALKASLQAAGRFDTYETAVRYQFYHALGLLLVGLLNKAHPTKKLSYASLCMLVGVMIFSGSLYLICFTGVTMWGAVAPIGGTLLMISWGLVALGVREIV
ncbi:MAG: DUF423 domain-containing protein [Spirosomataceae bacterium]